MRERRQHRLHGCQRAGRLYQLGALRHTHAVLASPGALSRFPSSLSLTDQTRLHITLAIQLILLSACQLVWSLGPDSPAPWCKKYGGTAPLDRSAGFLLLLALLSLAAPAHGLINSSWTVNSAVTYSLNTSMWWFGTGDAGTDSWAQSGCNNIGPYGGASCSPSFCAVTTNALPACTNAALARGNTTNSTLVTLLSAIVGHTCSVAPQTQDARCSAAALSAVYSKYPGILAAYCNEEYLVVHSNVKPNHPNFLGDIPTPPLGTLSDGSTCNTREYFQSWYYAKIPLRPTALATGLGSGAHPACSFMLRKR